MKAMIQAKQNLIFIDMGYLLFYRYYATKKYIKNQNIDETEELLLQMYSNHLEQQLKKIKKQYNVDNDSMFFCNDSPQSTIWRMKIYPQYKATRNNNDLLIPKVYQILHNIVNKHGNILEIATLEADDIVALSIKQIREKYPTKNIYIFANDKDYLQICDSYTHIVNATGKKLERRQDNQEDLWIKILTGDKSDNITPICKGCGPKTAQKLISNKDSLDQYVKQHNCEDILKRNITLVDFREIPEYLINEFNKKYMFE